MVRQDERQRLVREFQSESFRVFDEVLKCGGCLLILMCMALAGAMMDMQQEVRTDAQAKSASARIQLQAKMSESADHARPPGQSAAPNSNVVR